MIATVIHELHWQKQLEFLVKAATFLYLEYESKTSFRDRVCQLNHIIMVKSRC